MPMFAVAGRVGHLLENETYVGGHVEALQSGVFRNDIPNNFKLEPAAYQGLIDKIDRSLTFALEVESGYQRADVVNYEEVRLLPESLTRSQRVLKSVLDNS